MMITVSLY